MYYDRQPHLSPNSSFHPAPLSVFCFRSFFRCRSSFLSALCKMLFLQLLCFENDPFLWGGVCPPHSGSRLSLHATLFKFFLFILLRTLLHSARTQVFSFQAIPHSLPKTTGGGVGTPLLVPCGQEASYPR